MAKFSSSPCLEKQTFAEVNEKVKRAGSWIKQRGHNLIFLYARNSWHWTLTDICCMNYKIINVPLYDTLGFEAFDHILKVT